MLWKYLLLVGFLILIYIRIEAKLMKLVPNWHSTFAERRQTQSSKLIQPHHPPWKQGKPHQFFVFILHFMILATVDANNSYDPAWNLVLTKNAADWEWKCQFFIQITSPVPAHSTIHGTFTRVIGLFCQHLNCTKCPWSCWPQTKRKGD